MGVETIGKSLPEEGRFSAAAPPGSPGSPGAAHQYVHRASGLVLDEQLFGDRIVRFLYSTVRENAPALFRWLTGARASALLGALNFDLPLAPQLMGNQRFLARCGVDLGECVERPEHFDTPRKIFERQIRYWSCRPIPGDPSLVVCPADARVVVGSLAESSALFIKGKFFELEELLGESGRARVERFRGGDFAVFRLTPDKYHYNHTPVAGRVVDIYEIAGTFHACNPAVVAEIATPFSKNRRVVTLIDTDVEGGTGVGLVAMIEVVALMIGRVEQAYSATRYESPRAIEPGLFVKRGVPKSLYRPGSSTDVLLFEPGRVRFEEDLAGNRSRGGVSTRLSGLLGQPLVETDVNVRSALARNARVAGTDGENHE